MNSNMKKSRPDAGTPGRMAEKATLVEASTSTNNCTSFNCNGQAKIAPLLGHGQDAAISCKDLSAMSGLNSRIVRQLIEKERRAGILILSDNQHGYWISSDPAEAEQFTRSMRHRAHEILKTASIIETAAQQTTLAGW